MSDLLGTLDIVAAEMAKDMPHLSEAEIALATVRLNLTVAGTMLARIGITGEGLSNDAMYGFCTGLVETCEWIVAKEEAWASASEIEDFANGEG